MRAWAMAIAAAVLLAGCSRGLDRKIDGSSEESCRASLAKIRQEAKPEEVAKFDSALATIAMADLGLGGNGGGGLLGALSKMATSSPETFTKALQVKLDGKTGQQVIAIAAETRREQSRKQLASVSSEIAALEKAKQAAEDAKAILARIEVSNPRFYFSASSFLSQAVIDMTIKNGTDRALKRLYFHGVLATPGRSIPWVSDDFNYEVAGGLEPGESKHLKLQPNLFMGKWNSPELRSHKDLVLTVDVLNAEIASGEKLAAAFTKSDAERLATLQQMRADLEKAIAAN